jgi:hypothetical protein
MVDEEARLALPRISDKIAEFLRVDTNVRGWRSVRRFSTAREQALDFFGFEQNRIAVQARADMEEAAQERACGVAAPRLVRLLHRVQCVVHLAQSELRVASSGMASSPR